MILSVNIVFSTLYDTVKSTSETKNKLKKKNQLYIVTKGLTLCAEFLVPKFKFYNELKK